MPTSEYQIVVSGSVVTPPLVTDDGYQLCRPVPKSAFRNTWRWMFGPSLMTSPEASAQWVGSWMTPISPAVVAQEPEASGSTSWGRGLGEQTTERPLIVMV